MYIIMCTSVAFAEAVEKALHHTGIEFDDVSTSLPGDLDGGLSNWCKASSLDRLYLLKAEPGDCTSTSLYSSEAEATFAGRNSKVADLLRQLSGRCEWSVVWTDEFRTDDRPICFFLSAPVAASFLEENHGGFLHATDMKYGATCIGLDLTVIISNASAPWRSNLFGRAGMH